jgi:hypothetical protein
LFNGSYRLKEGRGAAAPDDRPRHASQEEEKQERIGQMKQDIVDMIASGLKAED